MSNCTPNIAPSRRRGVGLIEVSIALILLVMVTFGAIEFGYYFYVKHACAESAARGAWAASLSSATNSSVTTAVANEMALCGLKNSGYTITTTPTDITTADPGTTITVKVSCTWGTAAKGFRPMALIGTSKVVASSSIMPKQASAN